MHARFFSAQVSPEKVEEFIRLWYDEMLPGAKLQQGWKSARLFVERKTGKVSIVGLWETEADALATGAGSAHAERIMGILRTLLVAPPVVEHYEVAGDA